MTGPRGPVPRLPGDDEAAVRDRIAALVVELRGGASLTGAEIACAAYAVLAGGDPAPRMWPAAWLVAEAVVALTPEPGGADPEETRP